MQDRGIWRSCQAAALAMISLAEEASPGPAQVLRGIDGTEKAPEVLQPAIGRDPLLRKRDRQIPLDVSPNRASTQSHKSGLPVRSMNRGDFIAHTYGATFNLNLRIRERVSAFGYSATITAEGER